MLQLGVQRNNAGTARLIRVSHEFLMHLACGLCLG